MSSVVRAAVLLGVVGALGVGRLLVGVYRRQAILDRVVDEEGNKIGRISFWGVLWSMLKRSNKGYLEDMLDLKKKLGSECCFFFIYPFVTFSKPEDVRLILRKIDEIPKDEMQFRGSNLTPLFGSQSIIALNNPQWHSHRSLLNRSFTDNKVFFEPLQKKAQQCIDLWKTDKPVPVCVALQKMTLDALGCCIFGRDFDTLSGQLSGPLQAYNYMIENMINPLYFLFPFLLKLPLPSIKKLLRSCDEFDNYCHTIINQSKDEQNTEGHLISAMVNSGLSAEVVRDNVGLFFFAGHETTSSTLAWAVGLLATHPEVQEKLRREVTSITDQRPLAYEDLKDLSYLDWFIHETMRFQPVVPVIGSRIITQDTKIGKWFLPASIRVQVDLVNMLYDPSIWPDPTRFDPERWSPDRLTKEQRTSWIPFSYGPRVCIGMNFSLVEQKIFLATLVREFKEIKLAPEGSLVVKPFGSTHHPNGEKLLILFS